MKDMKSMTECGVGRIREAIKIQREHEFCSRNCKIIVSDGLVLSFDHVKECKGFKDEKHFDE